VSAWLDRQLAPVDTLNAGHAVVLDADRVVDLGRFTGCVVEAGDWWTLRAAYEDRARRRRIEDGPLVIVVNGALAAKALPWDIEHTATAIVHVRLPGPPAVRLALAGLAGDEADRAIAAVEGAADPAGALIGAITGMAPPGVQASAVDQLRLAVRLALRRDDPRALADLARAWVHEPVLVGLLSSPPDCSGLQTAWAGFAGGEATWGESFGAARADLGQLFAAGLLVAVVANPALPSWASFGVRSASPGERAEVLLDTMPGPFPPADAAGWIQLGTWWGEVRRLVAGESLDLAQRAWERWAQMDAAFLAWLQERFGAVLSSAARWPPALHRVAHHLARRLREGQAERVVLVVLDGLGHTQWAHLRERTGLNVVEAGSTFAMVPTYTSVSRQAIFAGELPVGFPDTLWRTDPEKRRWRELWVAQGMDVTEVAYHRVGGHFPHDRIEFAAARAVGVVINAVDDFMHGAELLGDAQLLANLDAWVANGFLVDLVRRADDAGFEVWLTSDHGNLECLPAGAPSEGLGIEGAGKRLLRYPNRVLRDASGAVGITWDHIPGLPESADHLLRFAPGRLAYTSQSLSVTHGGLSLDEVIVPLLRVTP
jgi:hypothetical protein